MASTSYTLYYSSQKCELSATVWNKLQQYPALFNMFKKIDLQDKRNTYPSYIRYTPTIVIPSTTNQGKFNIIETTNIIQWIAQWTMQNPQPVQQSIQQSYPQPTRSHELPPPQQSQQPQPQSQTMSEPVAFDFVSSSPYSDLNDKPFMDNRGTDGFTFLDPTGSSINTPAPPMPPSRGGTNPQMNGFPKPIETRGEGRHDEAKKRFEELQSQRSNDVPQEIKREGGDGPAQSMRKTFDR